jgi:hypothetical protein
MHRSWLPANQGKLSTKHTSCWIQLMHTIQTTQQQQRHADTLTSSTATWPLDIYCSSHSITTQRTPSWCQGQDRVASLSSALPLECRFHPMQPNKHSKTIPSMQLGRTLNTPQRGGGWCGPSQPRWHGKQQVVVVGLACVHGVHCQHGSVSRGVSKQICFSQALTPDTLDGVR